MRPDYESVEVSPMTRVRWWQSIEGAIDVFDDRTAGLPKRIVRTISISTTLRDAQSNRSSVS